MKTNKGGWNHKKKINFKNNPKWKKIVIKKIETKFDHWENWR
jgi:hypothetical protein